MTREELQRSEAPKLQSRRERLKHQRASTDADPYVVGMLNFHTAVWWLALYRELEGAKDFLGGAAFQLERATDRCASSAQKAVELHECFGSHIRAFFVHAFAGPRDRRWELFDRALDFFARAAQLSPLEKNARSVTPLVLFAAALCALAVLGERSMPPLLLQVARTYPVTARFRKLRDAITPFIDDPSAGRRAEIRKAYRAAISLADYRSPAAHDLQMEELLAISTVAEGGNVLQGAFNIFE